MAALSRTLLLVCVVVAWPPARVSAAGATVQRNLVVNGGFEVDEDNLHGEKMSCPVRPRVTLRQSGRIPAGWASPARAAVRTRDNHGGAFALLIPAGKPVT